MYNRLYYLSPPELEKAFIEDAARALSLEKLNMRRTLNCLSVTQLPYANWYKKRRWVGGIVHLNCTSTFTALLACVKEWDLCPADSAAKFGVVPSLLFRLMQQLVEENRRLSLLTVTLPSFRTPLSFWSREWVLCFSIECQPFECVKKKLDSWPLDYERSSIPLPTALRSWSESRSKSQMP